MRTFGPYSPFRFGGDFVFVSGQLGIDSEGDKKDIVEQTRCALMNVRNILSVLGLDLSDIIKATIFTTQIERFSDINSVWIEFFQGLKNLPARSTVGVSSLPKGALVEIEVIACLSKPLSLFLAGCFSFSENDFFSAHEYFEKAWKKERKDFYQGFSILSAFFLKIEEGKFQKSLLKKAIEKIGSEQNLPSEFHKIKNEILAAEEKDKIISLSKKLVEIFIVR